MNANKPPAPIIVVALVMAALCVSLDAYVIFGEVGIPAAVNKTMCVLRPLGHFASLLFPDGWSRLVSEYCGTLPSEQATSIIALTLKFSIVGVALILTLAMYPLREKPQSAPTEERYTPTSGLVDWTLTIALFCLPPALAWRWLIATAQPNEYSSALLQKAYEDIFLLTAYVGGFILWIAFCELALLPILRRLFPNQAWMRVK
jgi:hypothetical protein